ncbi:hypothetical protein [Celeribacter indicus]|uniref:hypothetical protein n=1 Tax=Celeribacter indicus TaxID=1208324 RepID=UPI000897AB8D|nr:hypothetical protein [Celeribacter indicus]SDW68709.1 hypothetical protein SAMN05443573_1066 [Celeribacter indicus]
MSAPDTNAKRKRRRASLIGASVAVLLVILVLFGGLGFVYNEEGRDEGGEVVTEPVE